MIPMQTNTLAILDAVLRADVTVTPEQRRLISRVVRGEPAPTPDGNGNNDKPRIYSRKRAAFLVGERTTKYIDKLVKRGQLEKFIPPGNKRAIGITAESLERFLAGN